MSAQKIPFSIPDLSLKQFMQLTAKNKPDITGGCVVLTTAGLATTLTLMALEMSRSKSRNAVAKAYLKDQIAQLRELQEMLTKASTHDLDVFNKLREFIINGQKRPENPLYHQALIDSIHSPLDALNILSQIIITTSNCMAFCKKNLISDLESGLLILGSVLKSMLLFTESNLKSLPVNERKNYKALIRQKQNDLETIISEIELKKKTAYPLSRSSQTA